MNFNLRKLTQWVIYPWLLSLYPIVYLFSINLSEVREDDVAEVVIAALIATTVLYAVFYLLTRDVYKAGAITGVIALVFLTYGHFYETLADTDLGQTALMPVMVVAGLVAILLIWWSKTVWRQLTPYLNGIFAILLAMSLWPVVEYLVDRPPVGATALANPLERVLSTPTVNNSPERPDIYYIILDCYSSDEFWLREYGYDNSVFTDALEERGFYVAQSSKSNYGVTLLSLPTALNMRYITEDDRKAAQRYNLDSHPYFRSLIANNQVAYELKQLGYSYIFILSGYLSPSTMADTNIAFFPDGPDYFSGSEFGRSNSDGSWAFKMPFWPFFVKTTLLRSQASRFETDEVEQPYSMFAPEMLGLTLDELAKIPKMEEATFTFAHIFRPHNPITFDRDGNVIRVELADDDPEKADYFFDELQFLNSRILELVDQILAASSVPPIIILQADHGSDLGRSLDPLWRWTYFDILNAYHLPGDGAEDLYPTIPPVNSFRVIFNHYFGGDYAMLESRQYTVPEGYWNGDYFTHVPYLDDKRLNVDLGDHIALIYNGFDVGNLPGFLVFDVSDNGERGDVLLAISEDDVAPYADSPPDHNVLIKRQGIVAFYVLTTGEFQFNVGPDAEGHEWAVVTDAMPAQNTYGYQVGAD